MVAGMPDEIFAIVMTTGANALVTWGVVRSELKFLRRDVDYANKRIDDHFLDYPHLPDRRRGARTNVFHKDD